MVGLLKDKKIIVTGGAGFIGSHIVDALLSIGAKVTVVDNLLTGSLNNIKHNLDKITFIEKGFASDEVLDNLAGFDYICHQAALRSVPKSIEAPFDYHHRVSKSISQVSANKCSSDTLCDCWGHLL